jgi:hypothetical protein
MDDRIDAAERRARCANQLGCRPGNGQIAAAARDIGAGTPTLLGDRLQSRKPCCVGTLSMQHQALIATRQPARDRSSNPDPASGDD